MRLTIEHTLTTATPRGVPSTRVLELAAMFGLGVDEERTIPIVPRCEIPLPERGGIVFVTGPSGSGKSTILRLIAQQCIERGMAVLMLDQMSVPPEVPLIDALGNSLERAVSLLSLAGLSDAFVMLRTPSQLSDGQRVRFRIAQAMEWADRSGSAVPTAAESGRRADQASINVLMKTQIIGDALDMRRTPSPLSHDQLARFRSANAMESADQPGSAIPTTTESGRPADRTSINVLMNTQIIAGNTAEVVEPFDAPAIAAGAHTALDRPESTAAMETPSLIHVLMKTQIMPKGSAESAGHADASGTSVVAPTWGDHSEPGRSAAPISVMVADEFAATLDRLTAHTLARSIRRWIDRTHHVFIAATSHDDLLEALEPDVLVYKGLGDQVEVCER